MLGKLLIALGLLLAGTGLAAAEDCATSYQPGDGIGIPWLGDIRPAAVLDGPDASCVYTVRFTPRPGESMDLYPRTFGERDIVELPGGLPYDKAFGCPYEAGEPVDFRDYYQSTPWFPAVVEAVDRDCVTQIAYQDPSGADIGHAVSQSMIEVSLRPAELLRQDPEHLRREAEARQKQADADAAAARSCTMAGETLESVRGNSDAARMKRGVIDEQTRRNKASRVVVDFENVQVGQRFRVKDPSNFLANHDDAYEGAEVTPYRLALSICVEFTDRDASLVAGEADYFCFKDTFGGFVCQQ